MHGHGINHGDRAIYRGREEGEQETAGAGVWKGPCLARKGEGGRPPAPQSGSPPPEEEEGEEDDDNDNEEEKAGRKGEQKGEEARERGIGKPETDHPHREKRRKGRKGNARQGNQGSR